MDPVWVAVVKILTAVKGNTLLMAKLGSLLLQQCEQWRKQAYKKAALTRFLQRYPTYFSISGHNVTLLQPPPHAVQHYPRRQKQQQSSPKRSTPQSPQRAQHPQQAQQSQQAQQKRNRWRRKLPKRWEKGATLSGFRPPSVAVQWANPLAPAPVPAMMMEVFNKEAIINPYLVNAGLAELLQTGLPEPPAENTSKYYSFSPPPPQQLFLELSSFLRFFKNWPEYRHWFSTLLWIEELQMMIDIRCVHIFSKFCHLFKLFFTFREYDRENVVLFPDSVHVGLKVISVPGLAEKRPSVLRGMHPFSIFGKIVTRSLLIGDSLFAKASAAHKVFKGFVHIVNLEDIRVSFHNSLDVADTFRIQVLCNLGLTPHSLSHSLSPISSLSRALP